MDLLALNGDIVGYNEVMHTLAVFFVEEVQVDVVIFLRNRLICEFGNALLDCLDKIVKIRAVALKRNSSNLNCTILDIVGTVFASSIAALITRI